MSEETQTPVQIQPIDIQNAVEIIDYAFANGAFKDFKILEQVLICRNKLHDFVAYVAAAQAAAQAALDDLPDDQFDVDDEEEVVVAPPHKPTKAKPKA